MYSAIAAPAFDSSAYASGRGGRFQDIDGAHCVNTFGFGFGFGFDFGFDFDFEVLIGLLNATLRVYLT